MCSFKVDGVTYVSSSSGLFLAELFIRLLLAKQYPELLDHACDPEYANITGNLGLCTDHLVATVTPCLQVIVSSTLSKRIWNKMTIKTSKLVTAR